MNIIGNIMHFFVEMRANRQTYQQICETLESGKQSITAVMSQAADTPDNRKQAGHVIGMERWSTHRIASVLDGTPVVIDEHDSYRPSPDLSLSALADEFQKVRDDTLALAARLEPYALQKVVHNAMGEISVKTWLSYINSHSVMESRSIK
jgi:hypothetical protein